MGGEQAAETDEAPRAMAERQRAIVFVLGGRRYALRVAAAAGLAECGPIREVPGAPPAVVGLTEWRGNILTVLDLPHLLGHPPGEAPPCLVRLASPMDRAALLLTANVTMGEFGGVSGVPEEDDVPRGRRVFEGWFDLEGDLVRLIDLVGLVRTAENQLRGGS
jgi:chemotaxis signal transduction protein